MSLTTEQIAAMRTALLATQDPALQASVAARNDTETTRLLNLAAAPSFIAWRSGVTQDEIMLNGFDWARVDNLTVGKARIWEWMFDNAGKVINPSKANVRAGIDATWVGTAADLAVRAAVYVHCKRAVTAAERIFATGTGSDAVPGALVFEGSVTVQEVSQALNG